MKGGVAPLPSLEFLVEPAFLLRRTGEILSANAAARRLLQPEIVGSNMFEHVEGPREDFELYLRRSSGSTASIIGSATLKTTNGPHRFRLNCAALPDRSGGGLLVLRCLSTRDDHFSILGRQVRELNARLRERVRENAILEEALRQNQVLLAELQHRVKNNIQMMLSMIQMSGGGKQNDELDDLIERARNRLHAMAATQDAIYRSKQYGAIGASDFLPDLILSIGQSFGRSDDLLVDVCDAMLSHESAHALALIANELITNAIKHGLADRAGPVRIRFGPVDGVLELVVHDNGPGFNPDAVVRTSGLKLVHALCRQIGGSIDFAYNNGMRCSVRFAADQ